MTDLTDKARIYLIRKHGLWYRPDERGYTTSAIQAGRYTEDEALRITHPNGPTGPRDGMSVIHEDELLGIDEDWTAYSALLADRRDPAVLAALPEVQALIAAAYEVAAKRMDAGFSYNAGNAIRALTPADATAALAARDAAMIARGMREAATLLREQGYGTAPKQILARAAEIEGDSK